MSFPTFYAVDARNSGKGYFLAKAVVKKFYFPSVHQGPGLPFYGHRRCTGRSEGFVGGHLPLSGSQGSSLS